nr:MAG TPA: hypothetical protein [Caudoviricetes sp.]
MRLAIFANTSTYTLFFSTFFLQFLWCVSPF